MDKMELEEELKQIIQFKTEELKQWYIKDGMTLDGANKEARTIILDACRISIREL